MFLKQALSHIFVSLDGSCVWKFYKNTQICVPQSSHSTKKIFQWNFEIQKVFLKVHCLMFSFLIVVLINKYDLKKPYSLFISLVMQQWNNSVNFRNFMSLLKWICLTKILLKSFVDSNTTQTSAFLSFIILLNKKWSIFTICCVHGPLGCYYPSPNY